MEIKNEEIKTKGEWKKGSFKTIIQEHNEEREQGTDDRGKEKEQWIRDGISKGGERIFFSSNFSKTKAVQSKIIHF